MHDLASVTYRVDLGLHGWVLGVNPKVNVLLFQIPSLKVVIILRTSGSTDNNTPPISKFL